MQFPRPPREPQRPEQARRQRRPRLRSESDRQQRNWIPPNTTRRCNHSPYLRQGIKPIWQHRRIFDRKGARGVVSEGEYRRLLTTQERAWRRLDIRHNRRPPYHEALVSQSQQHQGSGYAP